MVASSVGTNLMQFPGCGISLLFSTLEMVSSVSQHLILLFVCLSLGKSPLSFVVDFSEYLLNISLFNYDLYFIFAFIITCI